MSDAPFKTYQVRGDGGARNGIGPIIGYASTMSRAKEMASKKGFWGGEGAIAEAWVVCVGGDVYALMSKTPIDLDGKRSIADAILRKSTIESLNPDQLRVLGIK